jgi:hypothetical protein
LTEIPFASQFPATYDPAFPKGKAWYTGAETRSLADIDYVVYHDAQGWRSFLKQGQRPGERASWLGSIIEDGRLWQHYPLEAPTWTSGTKDANVHGVAIEFEGKDSPITDAQVETAAQLFAWLATVCPNLDHPILGEGFREHRMFSGTSCPNGRIRWTAITDKIKEHSMLTDDDRKEIKQIADTAIEEYLISFAKYEPDTRTIREWLSSAVFHGTRASKAASAQAKALQEWDDR